MIAELKKLNLDLINEHKQIKEILVMHLGLKNESTIEQINLEFKRIETTIAAYQKISTRKNLIDNWIKLMSEAKTDFVLKDLLDFARDSKETDFVSEIVQISSRWNSLKNKINKGILSEESALLETGKINHSIIQIITEVEKVK